MKQIFTRCNELNTGQAYVVQLVTDIDLFKAGHKTMRYLINISYTSSHFI